MSKPILEISGEVASPRALTFADFAAIPAEQQIVDVSRIVPGRKGDAVSLAGILDLVKPNAAAK
jgi:DMSO/TMAO reductase YedYZ molybdopterin-dependent catalytic subunit